MVVNTDGIAKFCLETSVDATDASNGRESKFTNPATVWAVYSIEYQAKHHAVLFHFSSNGAAVPIKRSKEEQEEFLVREFLDQQHAIVHKLERLADRIPKYRSLGVAGPDIWATLDWQGNS